MTAAAFAFYVFAITTLAGGLMTVVSRNPVHSVLWLILSFLSSAGLFVLLGAEFVAMLLVIVYVGAVAVLFLFVVMMLDVDFAELKAEMARYMPLALLIGIVVLMQLAIAFGVWERDPGAVNRVAAPIGAAENTRALGRLLYDQYFLLFQMAGLILLTAMIGAIVLTLRHRVDVKRQDPLAQMFRDPAKSLDLRDVAPGQGSPRPSREAPDEIEACRIGGGRACRRGSAAIERDGDGADIMRLRGRGSGAALQWQVLRSPDRRGIGMGRRALFGLEFRVELYPGPIHSVRERAVHPRFHEFVSSRRNLGTHGRTGHFAPISP